MSAPTLLRVGSADGRSHGELATVAIKGRTPDEAVASADRGQSDGGAVRTEKQLAGRFGTIDVQGKEMSTLAGVYLYGIACFVCGFAIGIVWESTR